MPSCIIFHIFLLSQKAATQFFVILGFWLFRRILIILCQQNYCKIVQPGTPIPVSSARVGNKSTNSTRALDTEPFCVVWKLCSSLLSVKPGTWIINGTLVATRKLLYFAHSRCSPRAQPRSKNIRSNDFQRLCTVCTLTYCQLEFQICFASAYLKHSLHNSFY